MFKDHMLLLLLPMDKDSCADKSCEECVDWQSSGWLRRKLPAEMHT